MKTDEESPHGNDLQLAQRITAGDHDAFDTFLDELLPILHRFAERRLGADPEVVHDVVQSTVCKAIESLPSYKGRGSLISWACGICRFEVFRIYRETHHRPDELELFEESREVQEALFTLRQPETPETEIQRRQTVSLVHLTLDHLSEDYGSLLQMKYVEGLSVREIASRKKLTEKACESRLTRAREAFKAAFPRISQGLQGSTFKS